MPNGKLRTMKIDFQGRLLFFLVSTVSVSSFSDTVTSDVPQMNVQNNRSVPGLLYVLDILSWRNIVVLYSSGTEDLLLGLLQGLENSRLNSTQRTTFLVHDLILNTKEFIHKIYTKYLYTDLNIVILSTGDIFDNNHRLPYDIVFRGTEDTVLNTKSKWLLFANCSTSIFQINTKPLITNLTNVAHVCSGDGQPTVARTLVNGHFHLITGKLSLKKIFPNIQYKLNARILNVGFVPDNSQYVESMWEVLNIARNYLNFTPKLMGSLDGEYGQYSDGAWTGLIGQLAKHEVDFSLSTLSITKKRQDVVDFIRPPLATGKFGILYKKEKLDDNTWFLFWLPFQNIVYGYILVSYIIISVFFLFLSGRETSDEPIVHRIASTFLFVLGCLLLEGNHFRYRGHPVRVLLASWLLFSVVMGAIYTANLTRSLIPRELKPFNTIRELINNPNWQIGLLGGSSSISTLNSSGDEDLALFFTTILKRSKNDPSIMSPHEEVHIERAIQGKYALLIEDAKRIMKLRNECLLTINEDILDLPSTQIAMAVPKGSPFKVDLDLFMSKLHTAGILEVVMEPTDKRPRACHIVDDTVKPLYMDNMKGAFCILAIGVGLSGFVMVVELFVKAYTMRTVIV